MNAFHIMGLPVVWSIDDDDLEQRYEQCQMSFHPDKQSVKGRDIVNESALVTRAYMMLRDPVLRAQHILQLNDAWPMPDYPELLHALFEWDGCDKKGKYDQATIDFAQACDECNWEKAHHAYWWMARLRHPSSQGGS
jgi:hypothetical protein